MSLRFFICQVLVRVLSVLECIVHVHNMVSLFNMHMGIFQRSMCGLCVRELFVSVFAWII